MKRRKYKKPNETELTKLFLEQFMMHRYIQSNFINLLVPEVGPTYAIRLLKRMHQKKLLFLPSEQFDVKKSHCAFLVYSIDEDGEKEAKFLGTDPPLVSRIYRHEPNPLYGELTRAEVNTGNYWHALAICNILQCIKLQAEAEGVTFIPEGKIRADYFEKTGEQLDMKLPFSTEYNGEMVSGTRIPDLLFGLTYPDGKTSYFAGEVELTNPNSDENMSRGGSSWEGKCYAYMDIIHSKTFKESLGIPNMRVCVFVDNDRKCNNLASLTYDKFGKTRAFHIYVIPNQKKSKVSAKPFLDILTRPGIRAGTEPQALYTRERGNGASVVDSADSDSGVPVG